MAKIRIKEDPLNEMALASISSFADNLPFQVVLMLPDHDPPHAHIFSNDGKSKLGQILIPKAKPGDVQDVKELKGKLSDADKMAIFAWMGRKNKRQPKYTNWEVLNALWGIASK